MGVKGKMCKRCANCRERSKEADKKRDKKHRNELARKVAQKEENKKVKQNWALNNPDKVLEKDRKHKAKVFVNKREESLQKNKETTAEWRKKFSEEDRIKQNEKNRNSHENKFHICKNTAASKNLEFEFSKEEFLNLTTQPCHYCACIDTHAFSDTSVPATVFNGIDRKDSNMGYTLDNSVSCCAMCNQMKNSLCENVFIHRIAHIAGAQGWVEEGRFSFPQYFPNHKGNTWKVFVKRAERENLECNITAEMFDELHANSACYICAKHDTADHRNGLDRLNNSGGYTIDNVRLCCFECNVMKHAYQVDAFFGKVREIYDFRCHSNDFINGLSDKNTEARIIHKHLRKQTSEERAAKKREKEEKKREELLAKWPELKPVIT